MEFLKTSSRKLFRIKNFNSQEIEQTKLARVLSTLDLTLLGVGSTLGVGVYVLTGEVAKVSAGPAVIISFLIAAVASAFAGFCYAEFGARVPKSGSAYVYCYCTVGEFIAFLMGWNLILEYIIGTASVTKAFSTYLDTLTGDVISEFLKSIAPMDSVFLEEFADFLAFGIVMVFSILLAVGLRSSTTLNNVFTGLNLCMVVFVIIVGAMNAKTENWSIPESEVPPDAGQGGFMPFGVGGVIKGAATCFYGFIGFDCIATTGEEAKTPRKSIPIAVVVSLFIIFLAYFGVSAVLTLMIPYYDQDVNAPLSSGFDAVGWKTASWIVSVGALFGLLPSLMGSLLPLPRIIYAMAKDGLLFRVLGKVSEKYQSPVIGTVLSGFVIGIIAMIFKLSQLVKMMSIGTLLAYTIVAACVLILRYRRSEEDEPVDEVFDLPFCSKLYRHLFQRTYAKVPTMFSSTLVVTLVFLYCIIAFSAMVCITYLQDKVVAGEVWSIALLSVLVIIAIFLLVEISLQPKSKKELYFQVPLVPFVPAFSIAFNLYLMLQLDSKTWIQFGVWVTLGLLIYFAYGVHNSNINKSRNLGTDSRETIASNTTLPSDDKL